MVFIKMLQTKKAINTIPAIQNSFIWLSSLFKSNTMQHDVFLIIRFRELLNLEKSYFTGWKIRADYSPSWERTKVLTP